MWLYFLSILAVPLLVTIGLVGMRIYRSKKNLKFFKEQGIPTFYYTKGAFSLLNRNLPENLKNSNLEIFKKIYREYSEQKAFAFNRIDSDMCYILFSKESTCRDLLLKEENFHKITVDKAASKYFGLFYQNGDESIKSRAFFADAFNYEKQSNFNISVAAMIDRLIKEFAVQNSINSENYTKVSLNPLMNGILERIMNIFVFGQEEIRLTASGLSVYESIHKIYDLFSVLRTNPLYTLFNSLVVKYKLLHGIREAAKTRQEVLDVIKALYAEREKTGKIGDCALDRMIMHNIKCKQNNQTQDLISDEDLVGSVFLFHFAGSDTSQTVVKSTLCGMANREDLKQMFDTINSDVFDKKGLPIKERLESNISLNLWVKEALRRYNPIARLVPRLAIKDCTLDGVRIRKGDVVVIDFTALYFNENYFPKSEEFLIDRFTTEKEKALPRYQFVPFGFGKRICLGRNLGELMTKLITCSFCRYFDFRKPANHEYYTFNLILNAEAYPLVEARIKQSGS